MKKPESTHPNYFKSISRVDQPKKTHGWYVRVYYQGKKHSKFFSDKKWGGKNASLQLAIAWRDETESRIGKPRTDKPVSSVSNSETGIVGVRFDAAQKRYQVTWTKPDGSPGTTTFSINKYGKVEAFLKALNLREVKEAERLGKSSTQEYIASHHIRSKSTRHITFKISEELLEKVDAFNSNLAIQNRSEAIRILLEKALNCPEL